MALELLRAFAEALRLPRNAFDTLYGARPNEHIKLIRYPGRAANESRQGVGAHKDSGFLTLLLQDDRAGLEVELTPNSWVAASPLPGSFVVNIGELLELATNGYLRATVHRVVSPQAERERLSIAFFSARSWMRWCRFISFRRRWRGWRRASQRSAQPAAARSGLELSQRTTALAPRRGAAFLS